MNNRPSGLKYNTKLSTLSLRQLDRLTTLRKEGKTIGQIRDTFEEEERFPLAYSTVYALIRHIEPPRVQQRKAIIDDVVTLGLTRDEAAKRAGVSRTTATRWAKGLVFQDKRNLEKFYAERDADKQVQK